MLAYCVMLFGRRAEIAVLYTPPILAIVKIGHIPARIVTRLALFGDFADQLDPFVGHQLAIFIILDLFRVEINSCNFPKPRPRLLLL